MTHGANPVIALLGRLDMADVKEQVGKAMVGAESDRETVPPNLTNE